MIFAALPPEVKRNYIIMLCKDYWATHGTPITLKNLEESGVTVSYFYRIFTSLKDLYEVCDIKVPAKRVAGMSDAELRLHLLDIKYINGLSPACPSFKKPGTVCEMTCTCWMTDQYYVNNTNRQFIRVAGKLMRLPQLSFKLSGGHLQPKQVIAHACDNSLCYNPDHLRAKTQRENVLEGVARARYGGSSKAKPRARHTLSRIDDNEELLAFVKANVTITEKNEWLWNKYFQPGSYPVIKFEGKTYKLHRLLLANKLKVKYADISIARHILPNGQEGQTHDLNPDHLQNGSRKDNGDDCDKGWSLSRNQIDSIQSIIEQTTFYERGEAGDFDRKLAEKFNVASSVITSIRNRKSFNKYSKGGKKNGVLGKPIIQMDLLGNILHRYSSGVEAASSSGFGKNRISEACVSNKPYKEFLWMFESVWKQNWNN